MGRQEEIALVVMIINAHTCLSAHPVCATPYRKVPTALRRPAQFHTRMPRQSGGDVECA